MAVAALDDERRRWRPDGVQPRAQLIAEALVVIEAQTRSEYQIVAQCPFILNEQGLVIHAGLAVFQALMLEAFPAQLRTPGEHAVVELARERAVDHLLLERVIGRLVDAGCGRVDRLDVAHITAHLAVPTSQLTAPANVRMGAGDVVAVAIRALLGARGIEGTLILAVEDIEIHLVALSEIEHTAHTTLHRMMSFELGDFRLQGVCNCAVAAVGAREFERQHIVDLASAVDRLLHKTATRTIRLCAALDQHRGLPLITGLAGDHVHHASQRLGPVERGHGSANHFNALHRHHRHPAERVVGVPDNIIASCDALAIDHREDVLALHAAQRQGLAPSGADHVEANPGLILNRLHQIRRHARIQFLAIHHAHARGRRARIVFVHGGGHRHIVQRALGHLLGHCRQRQTERQRQRSGAKQGMNGEGS